MPQRLTATATAQTLEETTPARHPVFWALSACGSKQLTEASPHVGTLSPHQQPRVRPRLPWAPALRQPRASPLSTHQVCCCCGCSAVSPPGNSGLSPPPAHLSAAAGALPPTPAPFLGGAGHRGQELTTHVPQGLTLGSTLTSPTPEPSEPQDGSRTHRPLQWGRGVEGDREHLHRSEALPGMWRQLAGLLLGYGLALPSAHHVATGAQLWLGRGHRCRLGQLCDLGRLTACGDPVTF